MQLIKAFEQSKYENIETKYPKDYFKIHYVQLFRDVFLRKQKLPDTAMIGTLKLKDQISRHGPDQFKNKVALFGNFKRASAFNAGLEL